ncbi:MAG: restriction endonuclease subunit S [Prevotella sp.]|jgi:restriction modification system DNA specificity domain protein|uniref:restriction endonuclease subunit S n=1 Tax=Prevotella sp. TaxID=59823 RepID=UPI001CB4E2E6|nr:restriction endonuclease subunit S [Prevotella sp.]MBF1608753.1 restriction endonuclease subunit S [Prevotella sp.]
MEVRIGDSIECNPTVKLVKGNEYPLIDIDKISVGRKLVTNKDTIVYEKQSGCKFQNGDTLMARITPCLENGKMAMASIPDKGIGSTELFVFRGKKGITDNDFVYYFLKQSYIRNLAANSMTGASGRQRADLKFIKKIKFDLPSLPIQQKIASILSSYDCLIENNTRRIRLLEQMAENLYKEWFVRFRFPEHENVEMVNGLPKRWKVKRYEEELNIRYGKGLSTEQLKEEGYPVFGSNGQIGFYDSYMYEDPQILISCRGASSGIVNISLPKSFITSNSLICERTEKTESLYEYLKYYFLNNNLVQYQTGSAQPQITINNIVKLKLLVPELKVQRSFSEKIRVIDMEIYNLQSQIQLLTRQRDLLLPRLMSGKLEVKS